jgi:hypothetical protein
MVNFGAEKSSTGFESHFARRRRLSMRNAGFFTGCAAQSRAIKAGSKALTGEISTACCGLLRAAQARFNFLAPVLWYALCLACLVGSTKE